MLRDQLLKIAHKNPELRKFLIPLLRMQSSLRQAAKSPTEEGAKKLFEEYRDSLKNPSHKTTVRWQDFLDNTAPPNKPKSKAPKPGEVRYPPKDLTPEKMMTDADWYRLLNDPYSKDEKASSRTTPNKGINPPLGTWKINKYKGLYGRDIEELVEFQPKDLKPSETMAETNEEGRGNDAKRYADWWRGGSEPPAINVLQMENGTFRVTDGNRRWYAAKATGNPIKAWVSYTVPSPAGLDSNGKPISTGLTFELASKH